MIELIAYKQNDEETGVRLDIDQDESVLINFSAQEIRDFTSRTSSYSESFRLPFSDANNAFFYHQYDANISLDSTGSWEFNPYTKTRCILMVNSIPQIEGFLKLESVNILSEEYEVTILGKLSDFSKALGEKKLPDLSFTGTDSLANNLTLANVTASWDGNTTFATGSWTGDEVLYPLADYGKGYYLSPTKDGAINQDGSIHVTDLRPAVKVKTIWDKIFEDAGYSYTSTFLGTTAFTDLYMLTGTDKTENQVARLDNYGFIVGIDSEQSLTMPSTVGSLGDDPVYQTETITLTDDSGSIGGINLFKTSHYTATGDGFYEPPFTTRIDLYVDIQIRIEKATSGSPSGEWVFAGSGPIEIYAYDKVDSEIVSNKLQGGQTWQTVSGGGDLNDKILNIRGVLTINADTTQDIELRIRHQITTPYSYYTSGGIGFRVLDKLGYLTTSSYWRLLNIQRNISSELNPLALFPEMSQRDFVKAFTNLFNLSIEPSEENERNLVIEPYADWMDDGDELDWTNKIDLSKEIIIKPMHEFVSKRGVWKFADDDDILNKRYKETYNKTYGAAMLEFGDKDFGEDESVVEIPFSPLIPQQLSGSSEISMPLMYQLEDGKIKPVKTKPKLFYYAGKRTLTESYNLEDNTSVESPGKIPVCGHFSDDPVGFEDKDLMFGLSTPFDFRGFTDNTSYNLYWAKWVNEIYSSDARMLVCYVVLDVKDILTLRLNSNIWIKNAFYRINKIESYPVGEKESCRVEFIKLLEAGTYDCEYIPYSYGADGTVTFTDRFGEGTYSGTRDCCFKFGYFWFDDKCLWRQPPPATSDTINNNSSKSPYVLGDDISNSGNYNLIGGNNNSVGGNSSLVLGDSIQAGGDNSVFIGVGHSIGDLDKNSGSIIQGIYGKVKRVGESVQGGGGTVAGGHQSSHLTMSTRTDGEYPTGSARFQPQGPESSNIYSFSNPQGFNYIRIEDNSTVLYSLQVVGHRAADGQSMAYEEKGRLTHNGTTLTKTIIGSASTSATTAANTYWTISVTADTGANALSIIVQNTNGSDVANTIKWTAYLQLTEVV